MKTSWSQFMKGMLVILLLGSGTVFGDEAVSVTDQSQQTQATASLTPRQRNKPKSPVMLAQQLSRSEVIDNQAKPLPPAPQLEDNSLLLLAANQPPTGSSDPFIYSELDRLASELAKIKQDTKKPDTKKGWSTPKLNGRLYLDSYSVDQDDTKSNNIDPYRNKAGIRNMQFSIAGNGFDSFNYKLELSLSPTDGKVAFVDNWIGVKDVPLLGYLRAGHYKPETGLANPTSELHTPLSEFVATSGTFGFGRRFGVSSEHLFAKDRIRLFYGVFQGDGTNIDRYVEDDNQGSLFNIRLSAAPIFENEGRQVLHIGANYSYVNTRKDTASMSLQPGGISWYTASLNTGGFANDHQNRFGLELALQNGPFSMASELFVAQFAKYGNSNIVPTRTATGGYVQLGYFLTDDFRTYGLSGGTFGAAKVKHNFHPFKAGDCNLIDGWGAWQFVTIWNYLDLTDWRAGNNGGFQHDLTFGLNWFWNPNIRWIFEYIHSQQNYGAAQSHRDQDIFGTSLRLNF